MRGGSTLRPEPLRASFCPARARVNRARARRLVARATMTLPEKGGGDDKGGGVDTSKTTTSSSSDVAPIDLGEDEEAWRAAAAKGIAGGGKIIPQKYLVGDEEDALAALIATGTVDVRARAEHSGKAPIHLAAWRGSLATARVLLSEGGDALVNDISIGKYNYGKTAIFYAITRCRDDVAAFLLERGARCKIINNKGQSPYSLALSHCTQETCDLIAAAEKREDAAGEPWVNYRETHSDGLSYGDLDVRFYAEEAAEPGRGLSTRASRRGKFQKLNKSRGEFANLSRGGKYEDPFPSTAVPRAPAAPTPEEARARKQAREAGLWSTFERAVAGVVDACAVSPSDDAKHSREMFEIVEALIEGGVSGGANAVTGRAINVLRVALREARDESAAAATLCAVAATPALVPRGRTEPKRLARRRRAAGKALACAAAAVASEMTLTNVSCRDVFEACGGAASFQILSTAVGVRGPYPSRDAIADAAKRACAGCDARELGDLVEATRVAAANAAEDDDDVDAFAAAAAAAWDALAADEDGVAHLASGLVASGLAASSPRGGGAESVERARSPAALAAEASAALTPLGALVPSWRAPVLASFERAAAEALSRSEDETSTDAEADADAATSVFITRAVHRLAGAWVMDITCASVPSATFLTEREIFHALLREEAFVAAAEYASTNPSLVGSSDPRDLPSIDETDAIDDAGAPGLLRPTRPAVFVADVEGLARCREEIFGCALRAETPRDAEDVPVVAIDVEWRDPRPVSTVQLAPLRADATYVVDMVPKEGDEENDAFVVAAAALLRDVLRDARVKKLGFGWSNDWHRLRAGLSRFESASGGGDSGGDSLPASHERCGCVDLQTHPDLGLRELVRDSARLRAGGGGEATTLDKREQRSNWDRRPLRGSQIAYAALDAEVLLRLDGWL